MSGLKRYDCMLGTMLLPLPVTLLLLSLFLLLLPHAGHGMLRYGSEEERQREHVHWKSLVPHRICRKQH